MEIYIHARHTSSQNCTYTQKQQQCIDGSTLVPELVGGGLKATVLILWCKVLFEKLVVNNSIELVLSFMESEVFCFTLFIIIRHWSLFSTKFSTDLQFFDFNINFDIISHIRLGLPYYLFQSGVQNTFLNFSSFPCIVFAEEILHSITLTE